jgi:NADH dehydrogenase
MSKAPAHAVTGAFGYSGRYIAHRLLDAGREVLTLTNSPGRDHSLGDRVGVHPLCFDDPEALARSLEGVAVLYNTYWVRFNHKTFNHEEAVRNTMTLFDAARRAGVGRIVHVSITNPSEDSPLEYFRGKARLERALRESGLPHSVLRPTVLFGREDILVNNIAWALRKLPVFGVFGDGAYRLQPIHVDDLAKLAVEQGVATGDAVVVNAIGPETFTYTELVRAVGKAIGKRKPVIGVPPAAGLLVARFLGWLVDDVMVTREEIEGLMADLLYVETPPTGSTRLTEWMSTRAGTLGRQYTSELARRRDRNTVYRSN